MDALANWLWQGCAVALAATVILRLSRRMSATTRYRLWWMALLLVLILPAAWVAPGPDEGTAISGPSAMAVPTTLSVPLPQLPWWPAALFVAVWVAWAVASLWRTACAIVRLGRAKRSCQSFPSDREARLHHWISVRGQGRRARLVVSDEVPSAAVLGLTSPAIAVAPSALRALTDEELDQIVVHEWAHVQRHDDVARLLQLVVRALAGLHPAVWWIDRRLHVERETACDDWAVNVTGCARSYAACLAKLAALGTHSRVPGLMPAALSSSQLTTRVVRLLDRRRNTSTRRVLGGTALVIPVLITVAVIAASVELVVSRPLQAPGRDSSAVTAVHPVSLAALPDSVVEMAVSGQSEARARQPKLQIERPTRSRPTAREVQGPAVHVASVSDRALDGRDQEHLLPDLIVSESQESLPGTETPIAPDLIPAFSPTDERNDPPPLKSATPWGAAADAGVSVGRGSQKAAVATAGFFTRLSKSIAGSF